jgi:uncharacterized membrane protein
MAHPDTAFDHHDRTEFQLERLILFTDAVFAIAITLLAIEIKIPEFGGRPNDGQVWESMVELIPKFVGFLVGFAVIAIYWTAHHRIFRFVRSYDQKLLWLNILFLLFIVLMPFSSGLFSSYPTVKAPFTIYALNIIVTALAQVCVTRYLLNPAHHLIHPTDATHPDLDWWRSLVPAAGFIVALIVVQFIPANNWLRNFTPFLFLLTIPFSRLYQRRYRRLQAQHAARQAASIEA